MKIKVKDLSYRYPKTGTPIFTSLCMDISGPGFHGLFGQSGVGKTTLARILAGLIKNYQGEIEAGNAQPVLYTYNQERLPGWCSVGEHLKAVSLDPAAAYGLMELFGLDRLADHRFRELSLGQQNRLNLLRYLMQTFAFLIMDESLGNVDEATRHRIIIMIKERFPHKTFLYISHNVLEVARFCREIHILTSRANDANQMITIPGFDIQRLEECGHKETEAKVGQIVGQILRAS